MKLLQLFLRQVLCVVALSGLAGQVAFCQEPVPAAEPIRGMIGVGTWSTQAEFKDIKVTKAGQTLYASDFSQGMQGWQTSLGDWQVVDGTLRQTNAQVNARALIGEPTWSDYTLTLKARKLGGSEGFLILVGAPDTTTKSWWNLGGWGNTQHALEVPGMGTRPTPGKIETGRWYDIKIELKANTMRAYLDNQLVQEAKVAPARRISGQALIPDLIADPSVVDIDGTFYCYATTDGAGGGLSQSGPPVAWKSADFLNWSFSGSIFPANFAAKYWAPSSLIRRDGRYYLFPTLDNKITALVANSPEGPFHTLDGKDINRGSGWQPFPIKVGNPIDAEVFVDDDGAAYMVWSQRGIGKLQSDFSGFAGEQTLIPTKRGGYSEGPFLFKRDGIYYYLYTLEGYESYKYAYMMSRTSPLGPWEAPAQDIIAATDQGQGIYGPGHGCFFHPKDSNQWYFVYLEYGRGGTTRQVWADKMNFNADGTIQPIQLTLGGVGPLRDAPEGTAGSASNLALGKTATASSTLPSYSVPPHSDPTLSRVENYLVGNAVDGSNSTRWMALNDDVAPWYQLDLGQARNIKRTELYFSNPTAGHAYRLEYSLDGESWRPYGGHPELIVQSPHADVQAVRVRYLKLTILRGTPGLWEFRVF